MLCPNCNTPEDYKEYSKEEKARSIVQIHTCMCGRLKKQTVYQKATENYWLDKKWLKGNKFYI